MLLFAHGRSIILHDVCMYVCMIDPEMDALNAVMGIVSQLHVQLVEDSIESEAKLSEILFHHGHKHAMHKLIHYRSTIHNSEAKQRRRRPLKVSNYSDTQLDSSAITGTTRSGSPIPQPDFNVTQEAETVEKNGKKNKNKNAGKGKESRNLDMNGHNRKASRFDHHAPRVMDALEQLASDMKSLGISKLPFCSIYYNLSPMTHNP